MTTPNFDDWTAEDHEAYAAQLQRRLAAIRRGSIPFSLRPKKKPSVNPLLQAAKPLRQASSLAAQQQAAKDSLPCHCGVSYCEKHGTYYLCEEAQRLEAELRKYNNTGGGRRVNRKKLLPGDEVS